MAQWISQQYAWQTNPTAAADCCSFCCCRATLFLYHSQCAVWISKPAHLATLLPLYARKRTQKLHAAPDKGHLPICDGCSAQIMRNLTAQWVDFPECFLCVVAKCPCRRLHPHRTQAQALDWISHSERTNKYCISVVTPARRHHHGCALLHRY